MFGRYMQRYGESLEGRSHGIQQQTIIVDKNDKAKDKHGHGGHKGQKKKQVKLLVSS